ncbi:peptidase M48 Ste24p [Haloterrigena turkmenica DSM 5511]|uniref:Peptidase M48 Ste24p n=1 Tax=Haloterrigena turkmenica (strain ATCC 51198 / DSM 5511 / JCM 9101 / NCIMB 13204 / VKM B-1734 / 4k) TaxID=543526 RepID=D2RTL2_HALTV|nr:M48 family metalloprotease [Haloterrigena turkmenica]ADB59055.1 peptidase M48 Ste24p [Haloterrigena turkmenica DSM 5511]
MVTNSGLLSPIVRAGAAVVFALVAIAVAATVWTVTYLSWWQAIGLESASFPATVVALVPLAGLGYVAISTEGGPTLSTAAYVGCFAAASVAFFAAVWTIVFLVALLPLGAATASTAAGGTTLLLTVGTTATAAAAIAAAGRSADWALLLRMAVAVLLLALVTIGFLGVIWLLVALVAAIAVGPVLGLYVAGAATLLAAGLLARREFRQVRSIEERLDATPTTADDLPGIHAATTKVAAQLGVPKPTIAVSETYAPEAMVVGFRPDESHLVLSYGAVTALSEAELEAVIAHELAHVANRDAMVMTAVSTPLVLAEGLRARVRTDTFEEDEEWQPPEERPDADAEWGSEEIFGPNDEWRMEPPTETEEATDERDDDDGWFVRMTLFVIATVTWVVSRAIVAVLSRSRETTADRTAVAVTGSPAALAGALRTLDDRIDRTPTRDLREAAGASSLSILPLEPVTVDSDDPSLLERLRARLFWTHPPTEQRLAALEKLERERR